MAGYFWSSFRKGRCRLVISANVKGERRLFAAIDRLSDLVSDQNKRGWERNVDVRLDYQRRHMDTEAAGGWTPLSDEYRLQKVEEVGALPILQYGGGLYRSLTQPGAAGYVQEEGADFLRVGSSNRLARIHHGGKRVPRREVIVVTDQEGQEHLQVIEEDYAGLARGLGFRVT